MIYAGAAPHLPAGIFSPYSDGEKEAGRNLGTLSGDVGDWRNPLRRRPSPRHYTGRSALQGDEGRRKPEAITVPATPAAIAVSRIKLST
ncbi:hypothetical protein BQ8482_100003 [Mesorhizobium delmotii]|uniref:Uncharacterized protein n=1 Tax=Mesorhizobium delmotii TaxID=1631247 RepID=A0A2P9A9L2_9HYPH|nr:hypothetical protein BQ8482_100003 [Mesorhizobium delmotii]